MAQTVGIGTGIGGWDRYWVELALVFVVVVFVVVATDTDTGGRMWHSPFNSLLFAWCVRSGHGSVTASPLRENSARCQSDCHGPRQVHGGV